MIIKGRGNNTPCDEGFVSFYDSTPASVFPQVLPAGVGNCALPDSALRKIRMRNFAPTRDEKSKLLEGGEPRGVRAAVDESIGSTAARSMRRWRSCERRSSSAFCGVDGLRVRRPRRRLPQVHGEAGTSRRTLARCRSAARAAAACPRLRHKAAAGGTGHRRAAAREDARHHPPPQRVEARSGCCSRSSAARVRGYLPGNIDERHEAERKLAGLKPMSRWASRRASGRATRSPILGVRHDTLAAPGKCKCCLCEFNKAGSRALPPS